MPKRVVPEDDGTAATRSYPDLMSILGRTAAAVLAGCATAAVLVTGLGGGPAEWVFGSVLLAVTFVAVLTATSAVRAARSASRRAAALERVDLAGTATAAVREERRRLSDDIARQLQQTMEDVLDEVARARRTADPTEALRAVRGHAQRATSELRRQLGVLRAEDNETAEHPAPSAPRWRGRDASAAVVVSLLALVESLAYPRVENLDRGPVSVALTVLAASTVLARVAAPGWAACTSGSLFLLGALVDEPIVGGFWILAAVCGPLWEIASRRRAAEIAAGTYLVAAAGTAVVRDDPDNAAVLIVLMLGAFGGGAMVRLVRRRQARMDDTARRRARAIDETRRAAVYGERKILAREMHDVVSHAVGVIAVQAGAAEVSWPADRQAAASALDVIEATARGALSELRRLPATNRPPRTPADLDDLVRRIRAGGTPVTLNSSGRVPARLDDTVYRLVQETLTNVVRHAPGAAATVEIVAEGNTLTIATRDDGPGAVSGSARGYGLTGITERVGFLGGRVTIGDAGEGGFVVTAVVPLQPEPVR